jgi:hypothetical protein
MHVAHVVPVDAVDCFGRVSGSGDIGLCGVVVEVISELLDPQNAGGRLSSYIDLPKRLGCPASSPDRLCCPQATSQLPRGA